MAFLSYRNKSNLSFTNSYNNWAEFLVTKVWKHWSTVRSLKEKIFKTQLKFKAFHWKLLFEKVLNIGCQLRRSETPKRHSSRWVCEGISWKDWLREEDLPQNRVADRSSEGKELILPPLLLDSKRIYSDVASLLSSFTGIGTQLLVSNMFASGFSGTLQALNARFGMLIPLPSWTRQLLGSQPLHCKAHIM